MNQNYEILEWHTCELATTALVSETICLTTGQVISVSVYPKVLELTAEESDHIWICSQTPVLTIVRIDKHRNSQNTFPVWTCAHELLKL